jgi:hypothetical protein
MKHSSNLPVLAAVAVVIILIAVYWFARSTPDPSVVEPADLIIPMVPGMIPEPPVEAVEPEPAPEMDADDAPSPLAPESLRVDIGAPVPLIDSPIVEQWMELEGYTRQEILDAQDWLRRDGYSPKEVEDPGNVRRHLPPRHVSSLVPTGLVVPDRAVEGEPITFVLEGRKPDPSFTFTRFIIQQQGPVILIRANGHSDGHMVAAFEGEAESVLLPGEIPPLPPGDYRVEILELGPHGSFPLTVVPADPE